MITIIFESHGTTFDNEAKISSGWCDVKLSEVGKEQAKQLGERYRGKHIDAIFCSTLRRSYNTAEIAFKNRKDIKIIRDYRLAECNYGDLNGKPSREVELEKPKRITEPFPDGESYEDTAKRMKKFLNDLKASYEDKTVIVIGHRATQYGLEHWIKGVPLLKAVTDPWVWQSGWVYRY